MGFSLKRALQGAVMGAAHEAGEVFDGMIAEERKQREADAAQQRSKDLYSYQADIIMDRERSRDELKDARAKKDLETVSQNMREVKAAVREKFGDKSDTPAALKYGADLAEERGYMKVADVWRARSETERSHLANEANRKEQIEARAEARAARKRGEADADHEKQLQRLTTYANRFDVPGFDDDGKKVVDKRAANAAFNYGHDEIVNKGRKPAAVFAELAELNSRVDALRNMPEYAKASPDTLFKTAVNPNWDKKPAAPAAGGTPTQASSAKAKPETGGGIFGRMFGGSSSDATYSAGDLPQQW